MAFTKQLIKNRVTIGGRRYDVAVLADGRHQIVPSPDSVIENGTPVNAELLQRYEDNIDDYVNIHKIVDNPHNISKTTIGLENVPNVNATNADNIDTGTLPNDRLTDVPQAKVKDLTTDLANKQTKSPVDGKSYLLKDGTLVEYTSAGTGNYTQSLITTMYNGDVINLTQLDGYKKIMIELEVDNLISTPSEDVVLDSKTFNRSLFIRPVYLEEKKWINTTKSVYEISVLSGVSIFDGIVFDDLTLIGYLDINFPPQDNAVGSVARSNDGISFPPVYSYAKLVQLNYQRDSKIELRTGKSYIYTNTNTTAKFITEAATGVVYKLNIYGINF